MEWKYSIWNPYGTKHIPHGIHVDSMEYLHSIWIPHGMWGQGKLLSGGDNQYEDSLFEKTGYSSSMEVAGEEDQDESVIGKKFMI